MVIIRIITEHQIITATLTTRTQTTQTATKTILQTIIETEMFVKTDIVNKKSKSLRFDFLFYGFILVGPLKINIESLIVGIFSINIVILSRPIPSPPCGGQPYLKKSR